MIIAPSVLSLDYSDTKAQLSAVKRSKAKWLHFDVMDGHFVPNLSFGPHILTTMKKDLGLFMDVHIMVEDPDYFSEVFIKAGADNITFHYEVMNSDEKTFELIKKIKSMGSKVGISIKPNTDVKVLDKFLKDLDLVLIMSVEPGFGGQSFIESSLDKIEYLRKTIDDNNYNCHIEVDGGIDNVTGKLCRDKGASVLVSGSYIFKNDIEKAVLSLC